MNLRLRFRTADSRAGIGRLIYVNWSPTPFPLRVDGYEAIGISEPFRFYRYEKGQFLGPHPDGSKRRGNGERSRLTFIVYLNDNYSGGETIFDNATITPQSGRVLLFLHGLMHESAEVLNGRKYVLRTDVMYAAQPFELDEE